MTLATPESVSQARGWLRAQEWTWLRAVELYRRSSLIIFSKRTWQKAYLLARSDFQRSLILGEIQWDVSHIDSERRIPNGKKKLKILCEEASRKFASRLLQLPGVFWIHGSTAGWDVPPNEVSKKLPTHQHVRFKAGKGTMIFSDGTVPNVFHNHPVFDQAWKLLDTCQAEAIEEAREFVNIAMRDVLRPCAFRPSPAWVIETEKTRQRPKRPRKVHSKFRLPNVSHRTVTGTEPRVGSLCSLSCDMSLDEWQDCAFYVKNVLYGTLSAATAAHHFEKQRKSAPSPGGESAFSVSRF